MDGTRPARESGACLCAGPYSGFIFRLNASSSGRYVTSARLPIKVLHSLSVPSMIGSEKDVYGVVRPKIEENLKKHAEEQVEKILG